MNTILDTLLHDLEEEELTHEEVERSIRKLAAIVSTYDEQIDQLEIELSNLKDKIK